MELEPNKRDEKLKQAKKRVQELKGFYVHLSIYIAVNTLITLLKIVRNTNNGESLGEAIWDFGTFAVWIFWGIGVVFHALKVFSINPIFNKDWEQRQIRKYMESEKKEIEKYK
ncbi:hypothetical protein EHW67_13065 [Arenibacter aquaticus]|uniref:2TM domain-containing protein n=1 Tax=Arenibacter aquaticus TaxID=2489054 RepID=A0A3S0BWA4_9FLAO|nr:2TM domain-containing protein [Arenibacter aquaticus]RTE53105.1 hypothetical protein EHW67_13065 [Arenibacter aquaticus]